MKVLHVISDENIGGAGVLLCNLLRHFDRERIESAVARPRGSALIPRLRALDVPLYPLRHPCDRYSHASAQELCTVIRSFGADAVHANAALCARVAARRCHVPVLHTRHCCYPPQGLLRIPVVRTLAGLANRSLSDRVIATADAAAENLRALGVPTKRIRVVINGSEEVRVVSKEELIGFRRRFDLEESDFTVGICARLEPCKGHHTFFEAARLLLDWFPQRRFRFLVVGSGSREQELRELSARLGLGESVRFMGFLEDMAPLYRILRINVNCSTGTETSCLALSEGMSAGVPFVASDYGGNPAMLGESQAGFLFPTEDANALADGIYRIAVDAELERCMREAARARYEQCYTAERMAERVSEIYRELLMK